MGESWSFPSGELELLQADFVVLPIIYCWFIKFWDERSTIFL